VRLTPLDRILIETDAPFLAPIPHRGKRNEPALVRNVAEEIARTTGRDLTEIAAVTVANTERAFPPAGRGSLDRRLASRHVRRPLQLCVRRQGASPRAFPLWVLLIAAQLVDVAWAVFVLFGIERFTSILPCPRTRSCSSTCRSPHSLVGRLAWGALGGAIVFAVPALGGTLRGGDSRRLVVVSHWVARPRRAPARPDALRRRSEARIRALEPAVSRVRRRDRAARRRRPPSTRRDARPTRRAVPRGVAC
jgi:hypothetical protein